MTDARCALVTGASGFVGRVLLDRLVEQGYRVIAMTRDSRRRFPAGVETRLADLATGEGMSRGFLDDVQTVFHCAGELRDAAKMRRLHVDGTERLLTHVHEQMHWVQLSSVGAYGPPAVARQRRLVDETTPENPQGPYEVTKTEADRLVMAAAGRGLSFAMLRPSGVIGAAMTNASLRAVVTAVRRRRFFYIGPADALAHYVHVDDVADALVLCATHPAAAGETFNLSSDCRWVSLINYIARATGVRPPRLRLPESFVRTAVALVGAVVPLPLTPSRVDAFASRTEYSTRKIETVLGFRHSRPLPAAIDDLLATG